jgi:outer membrane protein OmpA-like peptidoglycan-associated protein
MNGKVKTTALMALCFFAEVAAFGAGDDKARVEGMIITRTGETLIVSNPQGQVTVVLTADTRTKDDRGLFGLEKEEMGSTVLIPGLKVKVDGVSEDQGRVVAKTITVDGDDLETAEMIQSGLHPTAQQVAANVQTLETHKQAIAGHERDISANQQAIAGHEQDIAAHTQKIEQNMKDIQENTDRFTALSEYDIKHATVVKFAAGSSQIAAEEQAQLRQVAQTASRLKGYIIEVVGYTDSTGGATMNDKLSEDRAKAVVRYLTREGNVPVRHIVAPGAMGEYQPAGSNETTEGRAGNRRVEVKVLVNKGISGS